MPVTQDLEDYLRDKGVDTRRAAGNEITAACFFSCQESRANKRKLYLNTETWLWDCKVCGSKGGRRTLLTHFGDEDDATEIRRDPAIRSRVLAEYVDASEAALIANDAMLSYLFGRGLTVSTIETARYGYVPKGRAVSKDLPSALKPGGFRLSDLEDSGMLSSRGGEFHSGKITIPYITGSHVVQIRGKDPKGKYFTPAGDEVRLYASDDLRGADVAFITEGEFDRDIVKQELGLTGDNCLGQVAVVGIPGAGALPGGKERFEDYFRNCKRVYIGLDADETGRREAIVIKQILGTKARIIELPNVELTDSAGQVVKLDWTEYLRPADKDHPHGGHDGKDIAALMMAADMVGKRLFSVAESLHQWNDDADPHMAMPLGWPSLDIVLGGGLRPGDLMIPLAKTGTGKSVFLANVCWHAAKLEIPSVLFSMETTASQVYDIFRRIARFWGDPRMTEAEVAAKMPLLRIVQENRLNPEDFELLMADFQEEVGQPARLVMVDYLGYYARGRRGNSIYEKTSDAAMQLKAEAKGHRVGLISPHQVSRSAKDGHPLDMDDARDSGVIEETGDFVLGLYKPSDAIANQPTTQAGFNVQVIKGRRGGKGKVVNLGLSPLSLAMVDKRDEYAMARVEQEVREYNRGTSYDIWLRDQRGVADGRAQMRLVE